MWYQRAFLFLKKTNMSPKFIIHLQKCALILPMVILEFWLKTQPKRGFIESNYRIKCYMFGIVIVVVVII